MIKIEDNLDFLELRLLNKELNVLDDALYREIPGTSLALVVWVKKIYMDNVLSRKVRISEVKDKQDYYFDIALKNTLKYDVFKSKLNDLFSMYDEDFEEGTPAVPENDLVVVTGVMENGNPLRNTILSRVFVGDVLHEVSEEYFNGEDFIILPSSVHEIMCAPFTSDSNVISFAKNLVESTNNDEQVLQKTDVLSYDVYHYHSDANSISII